MMAFCSTQVMSEHLSCIDQSPWNLGYIDATAAISNARHPRRLSASPHRNDLREMHNALRRMLRASCA